MFKHIHKRRKKGQSTVEYAVLIIIVIAALLTIQNYIKRGLQGRMKQATDDIGDQFSPGNTNVLINSYTKGKTKETFAAGTTTTAIEGNETFSRNMTSTIVNVQQEFWAREADFK